MEKVYANIEKTLKFTCPHCDTFNQMDVDDYIIEIEETDCEECGESVELDFDY